jgi:phage baseplate assembly protein W
MAEVLLESMPREVVYGAKDVYEVMQCVKTILETPKGTCPLDREFGLTTDLVDSPMPEIRGKSEQEIFMQVKKYEPRAVIKGISWKADLIAGKVKPHVAIQVVNNGIY